MADSADEAGQQYQPEQTGMYELEFPAPQLSTADGRGPVLIHALEGFSDAGRAIRLAADHLKNTLDTELVASLSTLLPEVDVAALGRDDLAEDLAASFRAAVSTGIDGWLDDDLAFVSPWGFDATAPEVPVHVWQGDADLMVPFDHGRWLAAEVAGATSRLLPGEGHVSIGADRVDEALDGLLSG